MSYLDGVYAKWDKEIQEIRNEFITMRWSDDKIITKLHKADRLRVAAAMMSGSTLQYSKYPETIRDYLAEANHFIQKGACGLLQKSLALYREIFNEWKKLNGQQPPKN